MQVAHITTHVSDALARIVSQYADDPMVVALVTATVKPLQELEDAAFYLDAGRFLAGASGSQLDALGDLLGTPRNSRSDDLYLAVLRGAVATNSSDGTGDALMRIVKILCGAASVWRDSPESPGQQLGPGSAWVAFGVGSPSVTSAQLPSVLRSLAAALPAAVSLLYLSSYDARAGASFGTAGIQPELAGFGDLNDATVGGGLASLLYSAPAT